jgi:hydrogenase expression/formation protein HypE
MKLGHDALEALRAEITGRLVPGDDLVVTGDIAIDGSIRLIREHRGFLRRYFSDSFLRMSEENLADSAVAKNDKICKDERVSAYYFAGAGGILCAFWKMAEASEVGLDIDLRSIPILQETIEVCERLDEDPYKLDSDGCVLIGSTCGDMLVRELSAKGIHSAVIGHAVKGNDRLLHSGDITRYLERPRMHIK